MPLDPWRGGMVVMGFGVDVVDIFVLETGVPPATLELSTELVAMLAGSPCVSLEGPRDPVAIVTGGLVLELTVVATKGPLVMVELVVTVTGGALVSLKVSKAVDAAVLLITGLVTVTGGSLATSDDF